MNILFYCPGYMCLLISFHAVFAQSSNAMNHSCEIPLLQQMGAALSVSPATAASRFGHSEFTPVVRPALHSPQALLIAGTDRPETDSSDTRSDINWTRMSLVCGSFAALITGIHVYQQSGWWKDNRAPFHFQEDLEYGLWVDKIGHFFGASLFAFIARQALEWAGMSEESALWYGAGGALLFQTYVEIQDGFSLWGFDRVDFAADVAGAAWPVARYYYPPLRRFDLKFSYYPSRTLHEHSDAGGFQGQQHLIFDDYEGQTFWLSMKVHDFLPSKAKSYWPDFLCLAVGYATRNVAGTDAYPVFLLGLDLDMTKIIPGDTAFLRAIAEALNFFRLPLPALRISPGTVWYGVYF